MILEVLADARQVGDDLDAERAEVVGSSDPGELEELRRVERATAQDHLAGTDRLRPAATPLDLHARGSPVLDTKIP